MSDELEIFDYSKLKPNGYHYVVVKFSLPYALYLPIDSYDVVVPVINQDKEAIINVQIIIEDTWRNQDKHKFHFAEQGAFVEKRGDIEGKFRYTKVLVCIPIGSNDKENPSDVESIWNQIIRTKEYYRNLAVDSVNRFLDVYRFYTKEYYAISIVGKKRNVDFVFALLYNESTLTDIASNFKVILTPITYWGDMSSKLPDMEKSVVSSIRTHLTSQNEVPLAENLILNAYNYLDQGNYRLAIIEIETSFEVYILSHLRMYFKNDSNMLAEIDRLSGDNITNLVKSKKIRPAFNGKPFHESTAEFVAWRKKVAELRNSLVHGSKSNVTELEATNAIQTVEETLEFLTERPKTDTYLYLKE